MSISSTFQQPIDSSVSPRLQNEGNAPEETGPAPKRRRVEERVDHLQAPLLASSDRGIPGVMLFNSSSPSHLETIQAIHLTSVSSQTENPLSKTLKCSGQNLTDEALIAVVIPYLKQDTTITSLEIRYNKLTSLHLNQLIQIEHLKELDISGNPIGPEGAKILATTTTLKCLRATNCGIKFAGAAAFLENDSLEDLMVMANGFDQHKKRWIDKINLKLDSNKARDNPIYARKLKKEQRKKKLEDKVMKRIRQNKTSTLKTLIPKLEKGIHTRLEYGCNSLQYALDHNSAKVAEVLLRMGARLEDHEREYTALFEAAEKGHLESVELLLKRGANLSGEFYFNQETSLSIAAFKFCESLVGFMQKYLRRGFPQNDPLIIASGDIIRSWKFLPSLRWQSFSSYSSIDYARRCLNALTMLHSRLSELAIPDDDPLFMEVNRREDVYRALLQTHQILQESPSTELDDQPTDYEDDLELSYKIERPYKEEKTFQTLSEEGLSRYIAQLNEELKEKTEKDVDWSKYPRFFITQYRGIHYYRHYFSKAQRKNHRATTHLNRLAPAPAAYFMSNHTPLHHQMARESVLMGNREKIQEVFEELGQTNPTRAYWSSNPFRFPSQRAMIQQRMANSYSGYEKDLANPTNSTTRLLVSEGITKGYPHYPTSDLPLHALRYAYGEKPIKGFKEWRLLPQFQKSGKPLHPYPGKLFMSMFTPLQFEEHQTLSVAGMHNLKEISLLSTVAPERETSFPGGVESDAVFYEELITIPSFENYSEDYAERYGITAVDFARFKNRITISEKSPEKEREKLKNEILSHVIRHKETQLLKLAEEEARRRGGYLIYKHSERKYGIIPEKMRIPSRKDLSYTKREMQLFSIEDSE